MKAKQQQPITVHYEGHIVGEYCADVIVDDKIIVEVKAVKQIHDIHEIQLMNYLKATGIEVGLLVNFGEKLQLKRKFFTHS